MPPDQTFPYRIVLTTCGTEDAAAGLARALVERKLVACANIVPKVRSIYRWDGALQDEQEAQLVMKTRVEKLSELELAVSELHPYDVPEFIVIPIVAGSTAYLGWIDDNLASDQS